MTLYPRVPPTYHHQWLRSFIRRGLTHLVHKTRFHRSLLVECRLATTVVSGVREPCSVFCVVVAAASWISSVICKLFVTFVEPNSACICFHSTAFLTEACGPPGKKQCPLFHAVAVTHTEPVIFWRNTYWCSAVIGMTGTFLSFFYIPPFSLHSMGLFYRCSMDCKNEVRKLSF